MAVYAFLLLELIAVSYLDIKYRRISNNWPVLNIIVFLFLIVLFPTQYKPADVQQYMYPLGFLILGFIFFLLKIMGGGDSKFLFSFFLIIPAKIQNVAFISLVYTTIAFAGILLFLRISRDLKFFVKAIKNRRFDELKKFMGSKFPYAPTILMSWVWVGIELQLWKQVYEK